jgi:peptidyl-prolyl cis-trans isomerase B (cyclophilin B)
MTTLRSTLITAAACVAVAASFATANAQEPAAKPAEAKPAEKAAEAKPAGDATASDSAIAEIDKFIAAQKIDKSSSSWKTSLPKPPVVKFSPGKKYLWDIETNHGTMTVELMPESAPMHVTSTIYLTRLGFYDNTIFHRAIKGFMAQGGDPLGTGTGGPGYRYAKEIDSKVRHDRKGRLSMANAGDNTEGSQFFLTYGSTSFLDGGYSIFGQVQKEGLGTLDEFEKRSAESRPGSNEKPTEKLELRKATIRVN